MTLTFWEKYLNYIILISFTYKSIQNKVQTIFLANQFTQKEHLVIIVRSTCSYYKELWLWFFKKYLDYIILIPYTCKYIQNKVQINFSIN